MTHLLYNYFIHPDPIRRQEVDFCAKANYKLPVQMTVLTEESVFPFGEVYKLHASKKPTLTDAINASEDGKINIICNSDIIITEEALTLINNTLKEDEAYCLSRWEIDGFSGDTVRFHDNTYEFSQDTWAFQGAIRTSRLIPYGIACCDNAMAHELSLHRTVRNPCKSIKTLHYHMSKVRSWNYPGCPQVPGPHKYVPTE